MLPLEVIQKLVKLAKQAGIDLYDKLVRDAIEIEITEHVTKGWYMKLEIELGDIELELTIDKSGNIIEVDD